MGYKMSKSITESHGFYGNIFWRRHTFNKAGDQHQGHKHIIDHATLILQGSVSVEIENENIGIYKAGDILEIDKDKWHKFTALEDNTIYFCIFATNNVEGAIQYNDTTEHGRLRKLSALKTLLCSDCTGCDNK